MERKPGWSFAMSVNGYAMPCESQSSPRAGGIKVSHPGSIDELVQCTRLSLSKHRTLQLANVMDMRAAATLPSNVDGPAHGRMGGDAWSGWRADRSWPAWRYDRSWPAASSGGATASATEPTRWVGSSQGATVSAPGAPHGGRIQEGMWKGCADDMVVAAAWPCSITGYPNQDEAHSWWSIVQAVRVDGGHDLRLSGRDVPNSRGVRRHRAKLVIKGPRAQEMFQLVCDETRAAGIDLTAAGFPTVASAERMAQSEEPAPSPPAAARDATASVHPSRALGH